MVTDLKAGVWKAGSTERLLRQESRRQGFLKGFYGRSLEGGESCGLGWAAGSQIAFSI